MDNKTTQKAGPNTGFNLSDISSLLTIITAAFKVPQTPVTPLPPPLVATGGKLRPGLSPSAIAARIIARQSEAGRQVGNIFVDGPNVEEAMEVIRVEEIVNALLTEAKVDVVIPVGVSVTTIGVGNLGAPVVSQGATTSLGVGDGIIR